MGKLIDLTGKRFGMLTVIRRGSDVSFKSCKKATWICKCDCGIETVAYSEFLRKGHTASCGCFAGAPGVARKHGLCVGRALTPELKMFYSAKSRSKRYGIEFSISVDDIKIPDKCPVLGIKLEHGIKKLTNSSPTLDRIDNTVGYTRENIWVISYAANRCKSNLSFNDLCKLVVALGAKTGRSVVINENP